MSDNYIITSSILSGIPELVHGISTKPGGSGNSFFCNNMSFKVGDDEANVIQSRGKFFGSLGIEEKMLAIPQQVHSDNVFLADKPGYYKDADGLITQTPDVYLIISTADCYSVLICDKLNNAIGNIHSGWRGTQKKIVTKAIETMKSKFNSRPENLAVFIGPGISRDNFEVGCEVAEMFEEKYSVKRNGKYYIDLKQHIFDQLIALGINNSQIEAYPNCTFNGKEYLHSYRRDREKSGRMFSVIGMRG
jgi:YfiH family protein